MQDQNVPLSHPVRSARASARLLCAAAAGLAGIVAGAAPAFARTAHAQDAPEAQGARPAATPGTQDRVQDRSGRARGFGEAFPQGSDIDRARPPLVRWQRNLADALALQARTGQPLLLCVNMDGEAASESMVWTRYRDPAFAELTEGFVCLIVSPDRHQPLDRDDHGRRLDDPRFGHVIESEHVDLEPELFARYFNGRRNAPRHVGVAPDGSILFDLFLLQDLSEIDRKLAEFGVRAPARPAAAPSASGCDLDDPDVTARERVEAAFAEADYAARLDLVGHALSDERATQHPELLRLALRTGRDRDVLRREAVVCAARCAQLVPADLWPSLVQAAQSEEGATVRWPGADGAAVTPLSALRMGLERRIEAASSEARTLLERQHLITVALEQDAGLKVALGKGPDPDQRLDPIELQGDVASHPNERFDDLTSELSEVERQLAHAGGPPDPPAEEAAARIHLSLVRARHAELLYALSQAFAQQGTDPSDALGDAHRSALAALALPGCTREAAVRAHFVEARALLGLGDRAGAWRAGCAVLPDLSPNGPGFVDMVRVLGAAGRALVWASWAQPAAIDPAMLSDVLYLTAHAGWPEPSESDITTMVSFLDALGIRAPQRDFVDAGLARFPASSDLNAWDRALFVRDASPVDWARLESWDGTLPDSPQRKLLQELRDAGEAAWESQRAAIEPLWFRALFLFTAAEHASACRAGERAAQAYRGSDEIFDVAAQVRPDFADASQHYQALARAALARAALRAGDVAGASELVLSSLRLRPDVAGARDGLDRSPAGTAFELLAALDGRAGQSSDAAPEAVALARRVRDELARLNVVPVSDARRGE